MRECGIEEILAIENRSKVLQRLYPARITNLWVVMTALLDVTVQP